MTKLAFFMVILLYAFQIVTSDFEVTFGESTYTNVEEKIIKYNNVKEPDYIKWAECTKDDNYSAIIRYCNPMNCNDPQDTEKYLFQGVNFSGHILELGINLTELFSFKWSRISHIGRDFSIPSENTLFGKDCAKEWTEDCKSVILLVEIYKQIDGYIHEMESQPNCLDLILPRNTSSKVDLKPGGQKIESTSVISIKMQLYGSKYDV